MSKSKLCYDRRSIGKPVLMSSCIWGPRPDFCYCQIVAGLLRATYLTRGRVYRLRLMLALACAVIFTTVKISSICNLYLHFYMSKFYVVICQESGSLWTPTIYSFTCNSSIYVCTKYTRLGIGDPGITHCSNCVLLI
jgi:hypothetical protein